jgi:hypothetical protein
MALCSEDVFHFHSADAPELSRCEQ